MTVVSKRALRSRWAGGAVHGERPGLVEQHADGQQQREAHVGVPVEEE